MRYSALTQRYFADAPASGVLVGPDCARGAAGSRAAGTWVQFDVQVDPQDAPAPRRVRAVRFLAFGCPHVIAVAAWLAEQSVGMLPGARLPESVQSLQERFEVPVEKRGRLLIIEDAWCTAMGASLAPHPAGGLDIGAGGPIS
jgi:NifU-like protein involved in Fe-S cluster formation